MVPTLQQAIKPVKDWEWSISEGERIPQRGRLNTPPDAFDEFIAAEENREFSSARFYTELRLDDSIPVADKIRFAESYMQLQKERLPEVSRLKELARGSRLLNTVVEDPFLSLKEKENFVASYLEKFKKAPAAEKEPAKFID